MVFDCIYHENTQTNRTNNTDNKNETITKGSPWESHGEPIGGLGEDLGIPWGALGGHGWPFGAKHL